MASQGKEPVVSMGAGRKLPPQGICLGPNSPDGKHHFKAVDMVDLVAHYRCKYCPFDFFS